MHGPRLGPCKSRWSKVLQDITVARRSSQGLQQKPQDHMAWGRGLES